MADPLGAVLEAHDKSARRPNGSTEVLQIAFAGSGDYLKALTGALSTLGGQHGPIVATYRLLACDDPAAAAGRILDAGGKVPGWGASFPLPDPDWTEAEAAIREASPALAAKIDAVTERLGHKVLPNPSTWTAAAAILTGIPAELAPWIFVNGRLWAWTQILWSRFS